MTAPLVERVGSAVIEALENIVDLDDSMAEIIGRAAINAMPSDYWAPVSREDIQEAIDMLGGFMGSIDAYRRVEALRARLTAALGEGEE